MLRAISVYFQTVPAVYVDGATYIGIAVFGAMDTSFGSEEAAKYIQPEHLFWLKTLTGSIAAGLLALKLFRSTTYSDHKNSSGGTGGTSFITQPRPNRLP